MKRHAIHATAVALGIMMVWTLAACSTAPSTAEGKSDIQQQATSALAKAKAKDPTLADKLNQAAGYAVFPAVGKGAAGVGGAYGRGVLFQNGQPIGYCDLTQASVGLQLGGQKYSEIIAFQTQDALQKFKGGHFALSAQASAVALESGAAANAKYANGVAVFTMDQKGLMYEASIGGQKFGYQPMT